MVANVWSGGFAGQIGGSPGPDPQGSALCYVEGSCNGLAARGYSRDRCSDRPKVVCGLPCNRDGCPVAVRAFQGHAADPNTLVEQVAHLRLRFRLERVALVSDRGMIARTRIEKDLQPDGLDWVTALRPAPIRKLARQKHIQPGLFDSRDLAAVTSPDFPGERLWCATARGWRPTAAARWASTSNRNSTTRRKSSPRRASRSRSGPRSASEAFA